MSVELRVLCFYLASRPPGDSSVQSAAGMTEDQEVAKLPAEVLLRIFECASILTKLQLGKSAAVWRKAWKEKLCSHLVHLLAEQNEDSQMGKAFALTVTRIFSSRPHDQQQQPRPAPY